MQKKIRYTYSAAKLQPAVSKEVGEIVQGSFSLWNKYCTCILVGYSALLYCYSIPENYITQTIHKLLITANMLQLSH